MKNTYITFDSLKHGSEFESVCIPIEEIYLVVEENSQYSDPQLYRRYYVQTIHDLKRWEVEHDTWFWIFHQIDDKTNILENL